MEVFVLLVIIVLIFLTLNSKKQTFKNITYENDIEQRFKNIVDSIKKKKKHIIDLRFRIVRSTIKILLKTATPHLL